MKHIYLKDEKFISKKVTTHITTKERYVCTICGCEKFKSSGGRFENITFKNKDEHLSKEPLCVQ